ncbi:TPA: hypothetical protein TZC45_000362 [Streptococcus suis]|nr:hypothetical protein [Streptococcus suis]
MPFISEKIDQHIENEGGSLRFFKKGTGQAQTIQQKPYSPCFKDFYVAMGRFIGKDFQSNYTKTYRCWMLVEVLQNYALGLLFTVAVISFVVALIVQFVFQGEFWLPELAEVVIVIVILPIFGQISHNWFLNPWVNLYFENAYHKALAKKQSRPIKSRWSWTLPITVIVILVVGILTSSWIGVLTALVVMLFLIPLSWLEGFFALLFFHFLDQLFSKVNTKKVEKPRFELPAQVHQQLKERFCLLYQDFQKGQYTDAYNGFDHSQKTREEFNQKIQNFLTEQGLTGFHLEPFEESEIAITCVSEERFEATLFLEDKEAQDFSEFYLICQVRYEKERITGIDLVEIGY